MTKAHCVHGRLSSICIECNGSSICVHKKRRTRCTACGGGSICVHGKRKDKCAYVQCQKGGRRYSKSSGRGVPYPVPVPYAVPVFMFMPDGGPGGVPKWGPEVAPGSPPKEGGSSPETEASKLEEEFEEWLPSEPTRDNGMLELPVAPACVPVCAPLVAHPMTFALAPSLPPSPPATPTAKVSGSPTSALSSLLRWLQRAAVTGDGTAPVKSCEVDGGHMAPLSLSFSCPELDNDCRIAQFRMCLPFCVVVSSCMIGAHLVVWPSAITSPRLIGFDSGNDTSTTFDSRSVLYADIAIVAPNLCSLTTNLFLWKGIDDVKRAHRLCVAIGVVLVMFAAVGSLVLTALRDPETDGLSTDPKVKVELAGGSAVMATHLMLVVMATHLMGFPLSARFAIVGSILAAVLVHPIARGGSFAMQGMLLVGSATLLGDLIGYRLERLQRSFYLSTPAGRSRVKLACAV